MFAPVVSFVGNRQMETAVILFTAIACTFVTSKEYTSAWIAVLIPVLGLVACTTERVDLRFGALLGMVATLAVIVWVNYYVIANHGFMLMWSGMALVLAVACDTPRDGVILRRNAALKPKSTAQSATGIPAARLRQTSMGMTGGSFNTREFFHGVGAVVIQRVRWALHGLGFALPSLLILAALYSGRSKLLIVAVVVQAVGLLAERWMFFAQARHPQNVYYQVVS